jgi:hypothetical protein
VKLFESIIRGDNITSFCTETRAINPASVVMPAVWLSQFGKKAFTEPEFTLGEMA